MAQSQGYIKLSSTPGMFYVLCVRVVSEGEGDRSTREGGDDRLVRQWGGGTVVAGGRG